MINITSDEDEDVVLTYPNFKDFCHRQLFGWINYIAIAHAFRSHGYTIYEYGIKIFSISVEGEITIHYGG